MDILLIEATVGTHIRPTSIHGMLWLQTHFPSPDWDALASNQVKLPSTDIKHLCEDANQAGLKLGCMPAFSTAEPL